MDKNNFKQNTKCIHSFSKNNDFPEGVLTPIYTSTSYRYSSESDSVYYPRYFNTPNHKIVSEKIAALEEGEEAIVLSSGLAAITTTFFAYLKPGDHAVVQRTIYGGTSYFISNELKEFGIEISYISSTDPEDFRKKVTKNTKLIYIETPSNPLLQVIDIEAIAKIAKEKNIISIIDNTFATPINQTPITMGIDIVIHSGTKYLNGHSDVNCGVVVSRKEVINKILNYAKSHGGTLDSHALYLLDRGLRTLGLRVKQQNESALKLAKYLEKHPFINKVFYPGLESNEGHKTAKKQMKGFGGMLSFEVNCTYEEINKALNGVKLFTPAASLGGVESLICLPADTSHKRISKEEREKAGIKDTLVRVSVGIEDIEDLIEDLENAFKLIKSVSLV